MKEKLKKFYHSFDLYASNDIIDIFIINILLVGIILTLICICLFFIGSKEVKAASFPKPTKIQSFDGPTSQSSMSRYTNWDGKSGYMIGKFIQTTTSFIPRANYFFFDNIHLSKVNTSIQLYFQIYHPDTTESPITITSANYEDFTTNTYYSCSVGNKKTSYNVYTTYQVNCSIPSFYNGNFNFNAVETYYQSGSSYYIGLATDDSTYIVSPSNSDVLTGINGLGTDINNSANNIISNNNQNSQNIINNNNNNTNQIINYQNQNADKINDSINDVNNSITDNSSTSDNQNNNFINSFSNLFSGVGEDFLLQFFTIPVNFIKTIIDSSNTCSPISLGSMFGYEFVMPCIDLESILGSNIYHIIDVIITGCIALAFISQVGSIFNDLLELNYKASEKLQIKIFK